MPLALTIRAIPINTPYPWGAGRSDVRHLIRRGTVWSQDAVRLHRGVRPAGAGLVAGAPVRRRAAGQCSNARTPAAARGDRCGDGRRTPAPGPHPPRQCRASVDDRRPDRCRGRAQHRARRHSTTRDASGAPAGRDRHAAARGPARRRHHVAAAARAGAATGAGTATGAGCAARAHPQDRARAAGRAAAAAATSIAPAAGGRGADAVGGARAGTTAAPAACARARAPAPHRRPAGRIGGRAVTRAGRARSRAGRAAGAASATPGAARAATATAPQPAPPPAPAPAAEADFNSSADQNLAEMAQRLEAALRRPAKNDDGRPAQGAPKAAPAPADEEEEYAAAPSPPPARPAPPDSARPARTDARPARGGAQPAPQKSLYDSLEQEMASLLGRPNNKP